MGIIADFRDFVARRRSGFGSPEEYDSAKQSALEKVLGKMHDYVGHAIIPYAIGGSVDMYYFPQADGSTALATMELLGYDGKGPARSDVGTYELVAFTRHRVAAPDRRPAFEAIESRLRSIFTCVGNYSESAVLNSGDTVEVPMGEGEPNACLLVCSYEKPGVPFRIGRNTHGLLLVIEIFPTEMALSRERGSSELLERLKREYHYPFSDLDRAAVAGT